MIFESKMAAHASELLSASQLTATRSHTMTSSPISTTATALGPGVVVAAVFSGAVLAALVTAGINIWLARRKSREEERSRLRTSFAEAYAAYAAYKEFPYAIHRRAGASGEERVRLSEALREIQAKIAYHLAWTSAESESVGLAYAILIQQVRSTAGAAMHQAWTSAPIKSDAAMNISNSVVDLTSLEPYEAEFMKAVRTHLRALAPWWGTKGLPKK